MKLAKDIEGIETGKPFKLEVACDGEKKDAVVTLDEANIFLGP